MAHRICLHYPSYITLVAFHYLELLNRGFTSTKKCFRLMSSTTGDAYPPTFVNVLLVNTLIPANPFLLRSLMAHYTPFSSFIQMTDRHPKFVHPLGVIDIEPYCINISFYILFFENWPQEIEFISSKHILLNKTNAYKS